MKKQAATIVFILSLAYLGQAAEKPEPVKIPAEPLKTGPGEPLSFMALVSQPSPLAGTKGWTVETRRHRGQANAMAVRPDGKQIATGGMDGMVRVWDVATAKLLRIFVAHNSNIMGLAWSPDGNTLASAGDTTVRLWDVSSGRMLRTLSDFKQFAQFVAWSPNGKELIATGDTSGRVAQWQVETGKHIHTVEHGNQINSLAWSPDGKSMALSCVTLSVQLWTLPLARGKVARTIGEAGKTAYGLGWSPDGKTLAFGSNNGKTYLWDAASGASKTWDVGPYYLAWSPDGATLAMAGNDSPIHLFDAATGKVTKKVPRNEGSSTMWLPHGIIWSADSKSITFAGPFKVAVWEVATPQQLHALDVGASLQARWSPGRPIIAGIGANKLSIWDPATLQRTAQLTGHTMPITDAAWAPKAKTLATSGKDNTVRVWNAGTGKLMATLNGHTDAVHSVAWSPKGDKLASGSKDKSVRLWNPSAEEPLLRTLEGHAQPVTPVAWSPDGSILASADTQIGILWKPDTGEMVHKLENFAPIHCLAWAPGGKLLATGDANDAVRLWDPKTGKQREPLESAQFPRPITALAWSPDGTSLASGRAAYRVELWDVAKKKLAPPLFALSAVQSVAWSSTGSVVSAGNETAGVVFWSPIPTQPQRRAAVLVAREEWLAFITAQGHYATTPKADANLVYVVQTEKGQTIMPPKEFAAKFRWKNVPSVKELGGK